MFNQRHIFVSCRLIILGIMSLAGLSCDGPSHSAPPKPPASKASDKSDQPKVMLHEYVTIFGILVTPDSDAIDPKLARYERQLREIEPGCGFKLRAVLSKRIGPDEELTCEMGDGIKASTVLLGVERYGKVRIRFSLNVNGRTEFNSVVTTPTNQLFFCKKMLDSGERLLIGVGAR